MSTSKLVVVIFTVLCCTSEVICSPRNLVKSYKFQNKNLVTGKNNVDKGSVAYAVCKSRHAEQSAKCTVRLDQNVFTNLKSFSCPVDLITEHADGIIKYGEARLWGENKVIFVWRELFDFPQKKDDDIVDNNDDDDDDDDDDNDEYYDNDPKRALVTIQTFNMATCQSTVQKLEVDHTSYEDGDIFITTSLNSFEVFFRDYSTCDLKYCRMTVDRNNRASAIQPWFSFTDTMMMHSIENIENNANKLFITISLSSSIFYHLLRADGVRTLGSSTEEDDLGWSSSNGILSFCNIIKCKRFNYDGSSLEFVKLKWSHRPNVIIALYNLPRAGQLAVICDAGETSNYRFVNIGENGVELFSDELEGLKCSVKPDHLTVKIFQKSNAEYCVSIFNAMNGERGSFSMFCYTIDDMSN